MTAPAGTDQGRPARLPGNETARLADLRRLDVLDTPLEGTFDRLTRMAAAHFQVPIALLSLVDADRQWFKSLIGLPVRETSRDVAFCAHAILNRETMVVEDALADERFRNNPLVQGDPHIRFYAGAPLLSASGHGLGTVCIIDRKPRTLSDAGRAMTVSGGTAAVIKGTPGGDQLVALVARADCALYGAKTGGRDRVQAADD